MTRNEVVAVLARCTSFDRRTVGQADVTSWLLVLGDLTYPECDAAVVDYYKTETSWIMPAHIRRRVMAGREQWLNENPGVGPQNPQIVAPWLDGRRELES